MQFNVIINQRLWSKLIQQGLSSMFCKIHTISKVLDIRDLIRKKLKIGGTLKNYFLYFEFP